MTVKLADVPPHVREHLMELARCWPEAKQKVMELDLEERLEEVRSGKTPSNPKEYPLQGRERDFRRDLIVALFLAWQDAGGEGPGISSKDGEPYGPFLDFVQEIFKKAELDEPAWRTVRRYITGD